MTYPSSDLVGIIKANKAIVRSSKLFELSSGIKSEVLVDLRRVLTKSGALNFVISHIRSVLSANGQSPGIVGGPSRGADAIVYGMLLDRSFTAYPRQLQAALVQKDGTIEGLDEKERLSTQYNAIVVDDVTSTGASLCMAINAIEERGVKVDRVFAVVDRGKATRLAMAHREIPYDPILTYRDLGIHPIT